MFTYRKGILHARVLIEKIFNRNTLKVNYSCMPNLERTISANNKSTVENNAQPERSCICRDKHSCPLSGDCLIQTWSTKLQLKAARERKHSSDLPRTNLKQRFRNHMASFRNENNRNAIELSKHIWSLTDTKTQFAVTWKIMPRGRPYSNVTWGCNLYITYIMYNNLCLDLHSNNKQIIQRTLEI